MVFCGEMVLSIGDVVVDMNIKKKIIKILFLDSFFWEGKCVKSKIVKLQNHATTQRDAYAIDEHEGKTQPIDYTKKNSF